MSSLPIVELLAALRGALERLRLRWYLFGAQAAILYGSSRLTADVDVTVDLGPRSTADLVKELEAAGFRLRVTDAEGFVERTRVLPLVHAASDMALDVVLAGPGPEVLFLERARPVRVGAIEVPVACPEDLVAMKILAGRPHDLQDATAIVRANAGTLDAELVRGTLRLLEEALDQSDLLPEFERLLGRARA
ncbi:MAG: hypothetical protein HY704_11710 [Gemmatimonadetes bacterium]|nr:hypothetical protein [Gemmatimonadota bacterium]